MDPTESNPTSVLLFDVYMQFAIAQTDRMFSAQLVNHLNGYGNWTWKQLLRGKPIDDRWLARKLSPYGIRPRNLRINGAQAKGYYEQDMIETVRRYPFLITPLTARAQRSRMDPESVSSKTSEIALCVGNGSLLYGALGRVS